MWFYFFFFSSRRRHTRCSRDWSSDVCSSDLEVRFSPHIDGIQIGPVVQTIRGQTEFVGSGGLENMKRFLGACLKKGELGAKGGQIIEPHNRVFGKNLAQAIGQVLGTLCLPCIGKG